MTDRISKSPKGHVTLTLADEEKLKLKLDFSAMADADEYLGRSILGAYMSDPFNFHYLRVLIYFGSRHINKGLTIRSVKDAGRLVEGTNPELLGQAISEAMEASGFMPDEEEEEPTGED